VDRHGDTEIGLMSIRKRPIVILSGAKNLQRIFVGATRFFVALLLRMTHQFEVSGWKELTTERVLDHPRVAAPHC